MLMRFDPFREVDQLLRQTTQPVGMPMDAYRRGDEFVAEFDLPGVERDSIEVSVERNVLEITAQRPAHYDDGEELIAAERPHGQVTRQLFLGDSLDTERISAAYDDGVLTVVIPVAEEAKPHKVEIGSGRRAKAVGAGEAA